jgi:hypothetical protein
MNDYIPSHIRAVIGEVSNIRKEIYRLNQHVKTLRNLKSGRESILYDFMSAKDIKNLEGITFASVRPRPKRKPIKEKRRDAYELFEEEGIPDPESFWDRLQRTQKYVPSENEDEF